MSTPASFLSDPHIETLRCQLIRHPLYSSVQTYQQLRIFMESHVFAVWDFMSLLKALQQRLTCVEVPWVPANDAAAARLLNEIVLCEESDLGPDGMVLSHLEMYLRAMAEVGADDDAISRTLTAVREGAGVAHALKTGNAPAESVAFVQCTFEIIERGKVHEIAASFAFGREDLIPSMFRRLAVELQFGAGQMRHFLHYLERHVEVDGEDHGPMALKLIEGLCGRDEEKWADVRRVVRKSLEARVALWDAIYRRNTGLDPTLT